MKKKSVIKPSTGIKSDSQGSPITLWMRELIALGALFVSVVVFYWPVISLQGSMWNDFIEQYYPYRAFATRALRSLTFPFWNPYSFSGMPFFADIQSAVLYPLNLLLVFLGNKDGLGPVAFEYQIVFHVLLAGIFTYFLARDFGRSRKASIIAGMVFMLGGFSTAHIFHVTMIHALPWFTLSFFLLNRALCRYSPVYGVATAFSISFTAFAGHPQMYVYLHYLLGALFLFHIARHRKELNAKRAFVPAAVFFLSISLGAGISSVQLLPTLRLGKESVRPEMEYDKAAQGSFRPYRFVTLLAPNFYGVPNNYRKEGPAYWGISVKDVDPGAHYYWETALYVGVLPLIFAFIAFFGARSPPVVFLGIIALISFLIATGDSAPFFKAAYFILPGFRQFRNPARIGIIFTLAMSLLAAYGFDRLFTQHTPLSSEGKRKNAIALAATGLVLAAAAAAFSAGVFRPAILNFIFENGFLGSDSAAIERYISGTIYPFASHQIYIFCALALAGLGVVALRLFSKFPHGILSSVILLLVYIDFLLFGYGFAAYKTDPQRIYESNRLIRAIQNENTKELFRINSRDSKPGSDEIGGTNMIFRRNEGTVHSLFLVEGYNPLRLKRQLIDRKERTLDILNVKYKIKVDKQTKAVDIVPHPTYFPRVWICGSYRRVNDETEILSTLHDPGFDHANEVILEEKPDFVEPGFHSKGNCNARIVSWNLNRIVTEVSADKPAIVVLSEIYYPAWKAEVDGKSAKLLRADYALRAVAVPPGKHTVVCKYDDEAFRKGLIISVISLIAAFGIIAWKVYKRKPAMKAVEA